MVSFVDSESTPEAQFATGGVVRASVNMMSERQFVAWCALIAFFAYARTILEGETRPDLHWVTSCESERAWILCSAGEGGAKQEEARESI